MERWTPEQNTYLSCLLDDVTGTADMVKMRQNYCKVHDFVRSINSCNTNISLTGSKAEGLYLKDSDKDYMYDINNERDIEVSESTQDLSHSLRKNKLLIVTDNCPPAFVFLKCISLQDQQLLDSVVITGDNAYLSSQMFVSSSHLLTTSRAERETIKIQGPSIERWSEYSDTTKSGTDNVQSIRCKFWPTSANEWKDRPRHYRWPSQRDQVNIEEFGCHLVPIGNPLSNTKLLEWRLSFSIAEKMLVWSFNHTQLQCYALMKLILKEYVKAKCTEEHKNVLCSYFIKTLLFWQFETTDQHFWNATNTTFCLMYLIKEFYNCIQTGVLRHYFVPRFNLLEIKLTREAQMELLHLFGSVLEIGILMLLQCDSLSRAFTECHQISDRIEAKQRTREILKRRILDNDKTFMRIFTVNITDVLHKPSDRGTSYEQLLPELVEFSRVRHLSKPLLSFVIKRVCLLISINRLYTISYAPEQNKSIYHYVKSLGRNVYGTDISSSKLLLATFLLQQGDYYGSLQYINDVLSSIPLYALYFSVDLRTRNESNQFYVDTYCTRNSDSIFRAKEAWLFDMHFTDDEEFRTPRAVQIELYNCDPDVGIYVSPFTYAYYLMFLCYHELGQYENRERALRFLLGSVYNDERCCAYRSISFNIAGHCMLMAGYIAMARILFIQSSLYTKTQQSPAFDKYNSAYTYMSFM